MLKLADNPPMVGPEAASLCNMSGTWWVACTRPRFEKAFAWNLYHRAIGYFLPMVERTRIVGGRKRHVLLPLFASYVFFCGDEDTRYAALSTNRLCKVLPVPDQARLRRELVQIEQAICGEGDLRLCPFAVEGSRCRVKAGPLAGAEGVVVDAGGRSRIVLEVVMLGQAVSVEVDGDLLESVA